MLHLSFPKTVAQDESGRFWVSDTTVPVWHMGSSHQFGASMSGRWHPNLTWQPLHKSSAGCGKSMQSISRTWCIRHATVLPQLFRGFQGFLCCLAFQREGQVIVNVIIHGLHIFIAWVFWTGFVWVCSSLLLRWNCNIRHPCIRKHRRILVWLVFSKCTFGCHLWCHYAIVVIYWHCFAVSVLFCSLFLRLWDEDKLSVIKSEHVISL